MGSAEATFADRKTDLRERRPLGRTGMSVSRIGLGSSFGLSAREVQKAYHEYGINYLYWGSMPRPSFGRGIRQLSKHHRQDLVVVLQSYIRSGRLIKTSVRLNLRRLRLDHADVLLLGMYNKMPARRILDAAVDLRERGIVRSIAISCHHRPSFQKYLDDGFFDILHVRYNAAHRGAEREVFPFADALDDAVRPGIVGFTATRWGKLLSSGAAPAGDPVPSSTDCYRFVLTHPTVDLVLSGPGNETQLDQAGAALSKGTMDAEEVAWMHRVGDHVYSGNRLISAS